MSVQLRSAEVARWHSFILSNLIFSGSASRPMKPGFGGMFVVVLGRQSWLVLRLHDLVFQRLLLFHFLNIISQLFSLAGFPQCGKSCYKYPCVCVGPIFIRVKYSSSHQCWTASPLLWLFIFAKYGYNVVILM